VIAVRSAGVLPPSVRRPGSSIGRSTHFCGGQMEVGVRLRFNRTVSGWPGRCGARIEGPGRCTSGPGELVERDRADVIVTTDLDPLIVTAVPGEDQEALVRRRYLLADAHRDPGLVSLGTPTPMCPRGTRSLLVVVHPQTGDLSPVQGGTPQMPGPGSHDGSRRFAAVAVTGTGVVPGGQAAAARSLKRTAGKAAVVRRRSRCPAPPDRCLCSPRPCLLGAD
jgi:hypothetical protein